MNITNRDGKLIPLDKEKIKVAIRKAFTAVNHSILDVDLDEIIYEIDFWEAMTIEDIQDQIEEILMQLDFVTEAKAYILYRNERKRIREFVKDKQKFIQEYIKSNNTANATIDDNSNVANKNIGILNSEIHKSDNIQISRAMVMNKLRELFTDFDAKQYIRDLENHIIYKHDESSFAGAIAPYCCSISLYPFLSGGLKHIGGLSAFPQNIDSFCGMYINLIFATSAQFAGAVATSELLIYFNYFAEKEWGIDYYKHANWICRPGKKYLDLLNKTHYWCTTIEELRNHDFGTEEFNKIRDEIVENATRPLTIEELQTAEENIAQGIYNPVKAGDGTRTIGSTITQLFQQVVYSINQPAAARGLQSASE